MPRTLLIVTALVETPIGVMLLVSPAPVVALLLGVSLEAAAALVVARIAGAALLSLGGRSYRLRVPPIRRSNCSGRSPCTTPKRAR